jgi:RNA-directed DNA polymerase
MTTAPISLQDLRRSLYVKAKAEPSWRFWGLYVHVCKMETLREAYQMARSNDGAPGIDGVTFEAIEESGAIPAQRPRCLSKNAVISPNASLVSGTRSSN